MDEQLARVIAHHDWWAETYDSDYFSGYALYHQVTLDNIRRYLPPDREATVLDAGGGTGIWAIELAQMGYHVLLTDISSGMLEKARKKVAELALGDRVDVRVADIQSMPELRDNTFDMVLCQGDPISYCSAHEAAVAELARVARPGAAVIASVDSRASALFWLKDSDDIEAVERLLRTGDVVPPQDREEFRYVVHAFTPQELHRLFEAKGLAVERIIGKPVIARRLPALASQSQDRAVPERLLALELAYNDDPAYYPLAGHLEIVGRKR